MPFRHLGAALILVLVAWRAGSSLFVAAADRQGYGSLEDLTGTLEDRVRRGLLLQEEPPEEETAFRHFALLRDHVPGDAKVYYLQRYPIATGLREMQRFQRLLWLSYPTYLQPIVALPAPRSGDRPPLAGKPAFVLDLCGGVAPDDARFSRVAEAAGAVLYARRDGGR